MISVVCGSQGIRRNPQHLHMFLFPTCFKQVTHINLPPYRKTVYTLNTSAEEDCCADSHCNRAGFLFFSPRLGAGTYSRIEDEMGRNRIWKKGPKEAAPQCSHQTFSPLISSPSPETRQSLHFMDTLNTGDTYRLVLKGSLALCRFPLSDYRFSCTVLLQLGLNISVEGDSAAERSAPERAVETASAASVLWQRQVQFEFTVAQSCNCNSFVFWWNAGGKTRLASFCSHRFKTTPVWPAQQLVAVGGTMCAFFWIIHSKKIIQDLFLLFIRGPEIFTLIYNP